MEDISVTFGLYGIVVSYILLAVATLGFIGFELFHLATNLGESKGQLAGFGALALILGLGWLLGSGDYTFPGIEQFEISKSSIRLVDAGIIATYLLLGIATIGLVVDLILSTFKR